MVICIKFKLYMFQKIKNIMIKDRREHKGKLLANLQQQEQFKYLKTKHSFHLLDPSPWPLVAFFRSVHVNYTGGVLYMHKFQNSSQSFLTVFFSYFLWCVVAIVFPLYI